MADVSSLESLRAIGASPLAAEVPADAQVTELPDYIDITNEISRMDLNGIRAVNWEEVVAKSETILREYSKNLLVAVYLAYGLYETKKLPGLTVGLGVVADMVETFWQELHPPLRRQRGRIRALEWLAAKAGAALARDRVEGEQADCEEALSEAQRLVDILSAQAPEFGDAVWSIVPALRTRLEEIQRTASAPAPEQPTPAPSTPAQSGPTAQPVAQPTPAPNGSAIGVELNLTTPEARDRSLRKVRSWLLDLARNLRATDIADPRAYALQRTAVWLQLRELPLSLNGKTELPCPPREVQGGIEAAWARQEYTTVVSLCEEATANSLFWLDAHRIAAEALAAMGHSAAAQAVRAETIALLHRLPSLEAMSFKDGTLFADPTTRQWLSSAESQGSGVEQTAGSNLLTGVGA